MSKKNSDNAKGPMAGYFFQPERALLYLAGLDSKEQYISIELVDDVSVHNEDGSVIISEQDKHSILISKASTFQDSSLDLWHTFELWIHKLNNNIFESTTLLTCCTNKTIPRTALIFKI